MEAPIPPSESWAKLAPRYGESQHWHPLQDHCADVAACAEVLLSRPIVRVRLAATAGLAAFPEVWAARLAVLASCTILVRRTLAFSTVPRDRFRRRRSLLVIRRDGANSDSTCWTALARRPISSSRWHWRIMASRQIWPIQDKTTENGRPTAVAIPLPR